MLRLKYQILQISYHKTISNAYQNVQIKSALFNIYIFFQNLTSENLWNISFVFNEICREKGINWHTFSMCVYIKKFPFCNSISSIFSRSSFTVRPSREAYSVPVFCRRVWGGTTTYRIMSQSSNDAPPSQNAMLSSNVRDVLFTTEKIHGQ